MVLNEEISRQKKLMQINEFADDKTITLQMASDRKLFGPVYHGTTPENMENIHQNGFQLTSDKKNGYPYELYDQTGYPPPVDHLGYAIYFTTNKSIGKQYNGGTTKNLKEFYLDTPRLETINFGSSNNMMKWWIQNGYDAPLAGRSESDRVTATKKMTEILKSKYDAVWFKGLGFKRLLDGDQIAVFDPSRIYYIDNSQSQPTEIGSKVRRVTDGRVSRFDPNSKIKIPTGTIGIIVNKTNVENEIKQFPNHWAKNLNTKFTYTVKWSKGGTENNITDHDIEPK